MFLVSTTFWFSVAFVLFFFFLGKKVKNGLLDGLDSYVNKVKTQLDQADQIRVQAQQFVDQAKAKSQELIENAQEAVAQAHEEASTMQEKIKIESAMLLKKFERQLDEKSLQIEQRALEELKESTLQISMKTARSLLEKQLTPSQHQKLVDESISLFEKELQKLSV